MSLGPFDLSAGPFLLLYCCLLIAAWTASRWIERSRQPEGYRLRHPDIDELALLAGGPTRLAEAAVARLLADGRAEIGDRGRIAITDGAVHGSIERTLQAMAGPITLRGAEKAVADPAAQLWERMVQIGLAVERTKAERLRLWQTMPLIAVFGFGLVKLAVGLSRDRPVGILICLLIVTAVAVVARFSTFRPVTRAGSAVVAAARATSDRLRRAPAADEVGMAVALFGTVVLVGSGWEALHHARAGSGSGCGGGDGGDGGGCSDGGSGGSGCGGGGCGGCGS